MSKHKYEFTQEFGAQRLTVLVDLADDLAYEESELEGYSTDDMRDLLYDEMRALFRRESRFKWKRIDG